jgi:hypothetical protein
VRIRAGFEPFSAIGVAPTFFIQSDLQETRRLALLSPSKERLKSGAKRVEN